MVLVLHLSTLSRYDHMSVTLTWCCTTGIPTEIPPVQRKESGVVRGWVFLTIARERSVREQHANSNLAGRGLTFDLISDPEEQFHVPLQPHYIHPDIFYLFRRATVFLAVHSTFSSLIKFCYLDVFSVLVKLASGICSFLPPYLWSDYCFTLGPLGG